MTMMLGGARGTMGRSLMDPAPTHSTVQEREQETRSAVAQRSVKRTTRRPRKGGGAPPRPAMRVGQWIRRRCLRSSPKGRCRFPAATPQHLGLRDRQVPLLSNHPWSKTGSRQRPPGATRQTRGGGLMYRKAVRESGRPGARAWRMSIGSLAANSPVFAFSENGLYTS